MLNIARYAYLLLILWQPIWFAWLAPAQTLPLPLVLAVLMLPLLACLPWVWQKRPYALVVAGCLLLLHFSIAIMELWTMPQARLAAGVQLVLTVIYYAAASAGLRGHSAAPDK